VVLCAAPALNDIFATEAKYLLRCLCKNTALQIRPDVVVEGMNVVKRQPGRGNGFAVNGLQSTNPFAPESVLRFTCAQCTILSKFSAKERDCQSECRGPVSQVRFLRKTALLLWFRKEVVPRNDGFAASKKSPKTRAKFSAGGSIYACEPGRREVSRLRRFSTFLATSHIPPLRKTHECSYGY
jgi:hypothetical protein